MQAKIVDMCFWGGTGVKSFFYRYTSPLTGKLAQVKIGNFPQTSLAAARLKLHELKLFRQEGRCLASELKQDNVFFLKFLTGAATLLISVIATIFWVT